MPCLAGREGGVAIGTFSFFESNGEAQLDDVATEVFVVVAVGDVFHEVSEPVSDGVELVLRCLVGAGLAVL